MKVYVGHSSSINYKEELYKPLRNTELDQNNKITLPHEDSDELFDSKPFMKNKCDLFIAEVSEASTGLGIELGWADLYNVPIVCIHRQDSEPSSSISEVAENIKAYSNSKELVNLVSEIIENRE